ncbi:MAG: FtsX-like permease family protein [Sphingomicrobium sp.]
MKGLLNSSAADRRLLGVPPLSGPTPWVVAIMSFSILIIAAAGLALAKTASQFERSVEARYSIQVPAGSARLSQLLDATRRMPGTTDVTAVPVSEMRDSLRRWLGPLADSRDLPVPALINFDITPGADPNLLTRQIQKLEPNALIASHSQSVGPMLRSLRALQWIALTLVVLLAGAASAAIVLAARAALDTHRSTIEVLHGIGATDHQITSLFQRKIAIDALAGSILGAVAAALVLTLLAAGSAFLGQLTGGASLGLADLVMLALLPFALTALATLVARSAVLERLRRAL